MSTNQHNNRSSENNNRLDELQQSGNYSKYFFKRSLAWEIIPSEFEDVNNNFYRITGLEAAIKANILVAGAIACFATIFLIRDILTYLNLTNIDYNIGAVIYLIFISLVAYVFIIIYTRINRYNIKISNKDKIALVKNKINYYKFWTKFRSNEWYLFDDFKNLKGTISFQTKFQGLMSYSNENFDIKIVRDNQNEKTFNNIREIQAVSQTTQNIIVLKNTKPEGTPFTTFLNLNDFSVYANKELDQVQIIFFTLITIRQFFTNRSLR